jgi:hypothetical protein
MPCRDGADVSYNAVDQSELESLRKKNKKLEILLCSVCRQLAADNYDFGRNPSLDQWWDKHKKQDETAKLLAMREEQERRTLKAVLKKPYHRLTLEDKALIRKYNL